MQNHVIVVEPHADDACLSLHEHMLRWKRQETAITILTVQSAVDNRANEAEAYAKAIGVEWIGLGYEYGKLPEEIDLAVVPNYHPGYSIVISPLGIQHPDHLHIHRILKGKAWMNYVDIPYYTKRKNQDFLNTTLDDQKLHSIYIPHHGKRKYFTIFKSQARFFFYNRPVDLCRIPEILVTSSSNF